MRQFNVGNVRTHGSGGARVDRLQRVDDVARRVHSGITVALSLRDPERFADGFLRRSATDRLPGALHPHEQAAVIRCGVCGELMNSFKDSDDLLGNYFISQFYG